MEVAFFVYTMSSFADTAVVILNYNGRHFLNQFLPSVIRYSEDARIIVADNASTDDSLALLSTQFPEVELIKLKENYGFAGGYNMALSQVDAQYYILLNSDVEVSNGWLKPLILPFLSHPEIAAVQPKIKAFDSKEHFEYAGASGGFLDRLFFPYCRGRVLDHLEKDTGQYDDCIEIDWTSGACMAIRASDYHELGGLEASFFAHMEEIDLCIRASRKGKKLVCQPKSVVYHVGGGTLPKNHPRKTYLNMRNNLSMITLNHAQALKIHFLRFPIDFLALFWLTIQGQFQSAWAFVRAYWSFFSSLSYLLKLRKQRKSLFPLYRAKEKGVLIIWEYFVLKRKTFDTIHPASTT